MAYRSVTTKDVLTTAAAAYITAGANESRTIIKALACNEDTVARTITVYIEPSGGAATDMAIKTLALAAAETKVLQLSGVAIANSGKLYAKADANSVVKLILTTSVVEQAA